MEAKKPRRKTRRTQSDEHTPGPWRHVEGRTYLMGGDSLRIVEAARAADARRIVACVNACKGIRTEYLERIPLPNWLREEKEGKTTASSEDASSPNA